MFLIKNNIRAGCTVFGFLLMIVMILQKVKAGMAADSAILSAALRCLGSCIFIFHFLKFDTL
jgi:hypothetical protein